MKTILVDAVDCFIVEKGDEFEMSQDMYKLLETYSNNKLILTGASDDKRELFHLEEMPYEVFTLKHNPEKTNPEYYKIMLKNFGLSAEQVIYFEHNPDAVKSAESVGIKTYFYDNDKRDLMSLKKFLDENL